MSDYEPPAEMVDALRVEFERDQGQGRSLAPWVSKFVLRRQHEREERNA